MSEDREQADCASCGTTLDLENDLVSTDSGDLLCEDCRIYCERCEEFAYSQDSRYIYNEGTWCYSCVENYTYWCESCEETYSDDRPQDYISDVDSWWCTNCASDYATWCDNCDQYYRSECGSCERAVHDYSYKPEPIFFGESKDNLFFGLELEMEVSDDRSVYKSSANYVYDNISNDFVYLKHDGSIGNSDGGKVGADGFELVSHPATLDHWSNNSQELWSVLDTLRTKYGARSWNAKSNCGIHIHISRSGFKSGAHTHRFLSFIYRNAGYMKRYAGRDCGKYATFTDVWRYDENNNPYRSFADKLVYQKAQMSDPWAITRAVNGSERMSAVNTRNLNTIELRFFRGTTKPTGVLATIELAHAIVEYTRNLTLSDVRLGMLDWEWFADYIEANNGLYPNAYARIPKLDKVSLNHPEAINA